MWFRCGWFRALVLVTVVICWNQVRCVRPFRLNTWNFTFTHTSGQHWLGFSVYNELIWLFVLSSSLCVKHFQVHSSLPVYKQLWFLSIRSSIRYYSLIYYIHICRLLLMNLRFVPFKTEILLSLELHSYMPTVIKHDNLTLFF